MTGDTTYSNATQTSMGFETNIGGNGWKAGGQMLVGSQNQVSNNTPYSTGTNTLIRAKIMLHRYRYDGCGQLYDRAKNRSWTGGIDTNGTLDRRTVGSLQRIPLSNGQKASKTSGATRQLGFQLTSAPLTGMLGVQLQESTSWSKSLAQNWKAQASSQNYLCWGAAYESLGAAREVSASIQ